MAERGEASVEEILESIKKVIARDNNAIAIGMPARSEGEPQSSAPGVATEATPESEVEPDAEASVKANSETQIETDADLAPEFEPETEEKPVDPQSEVLDLAEMDFAFEEEGQSLDDEEDYGAAETSEDDDALAEEPLLTEAARGAMQDNLAALAMLAEPGARPQIVRSGETSLEGLTRELLRPMLAEWLDANLPAMVEKLVQAEIARIAGKRR